MSTNTSCWQGCYALAFPGQSAAVLFVTILGDIEPSPSAGDGDQHDNRWAIQAMPFSWKAIPPQFHYLNNAVFANHADEIGVAHYDPTLGRHVGIQEKLTAEELADLTRIYHEICQREDNIAIIDWLEQARNGKPSERNAAWFIQSLLFLLQQLAQLGIDPFATRPILAEKPPQPFDWSILPADLAYLAEAVEKYAELDTESNICDWLERASESELAQLGQLAQQMFADEPKITAWSEKFPKSREEFHVNWLYLIFDHADIELD
jgi:hypothetical protein